MPVKETEMEKRSESEIKRGGGLGRLGPRSFQRNRRMLDHSYIMPYIKAIKSMKKETAMKDRRGLEDKGTRSPSKCPST